MLVGSQKDGLLLHPGLGKGWERQGALAEFGKHSRSRNSTKGMSSPTYRIEGSWSVARYVIMAAVDGKVTCRHVKSCDGASFAHAPETIPRWSVDFTRLSDA